jgi:hypothetical protein
MILIVNLMPARVHWTLSLSKEKIALKGSSRSKVNAMSKNIEKAKKACYLLVCR